MKTLSILMFLLFAMSCSKDDNKGNENAPQPNTLTFKGNPVTFNSLEIDDNAPNNTTFYLITTLNNLNIQFYCKYLGTGSQPNTVGEVTYTSDGVNFEPVNNYPNLTFRGYMNESTLYNFISGQVKIKRNAAGNQAIEFVNLKLKAGDDEQTLNGTINLPKS